jgi:hypothetical protein
MKDKKSIIAVSVTFFILVVLMTYPLVFKITTHMPAFSHTDESYAPVSFAWSIKYSALHNLSKRQTNLMAYPFGIDSRRNWVFGCFFLAINYFLAIATTPILTYNLQVIINIFLCAVFTYLLVVCITRDKFAAFLSGTIFAFCPYIFVHSWQHLSETYVWAIPLFLWSLAQLKDRNTLRAKAFFMISFIITTVAIAVEYYTSTILGAFLLYLLFYRDKEKKVFFKKVFFLTIIGYLIISPQFLIIFKNAASAQKAAVSGFNPYHRPFDDLFTQSAKPLSYFLPATSHPVFGKFTERFIGSPLYGVSYTEHALYLGWVPLILAFTAFRRWRKRAKLLVTKDVGRRTKDELFYIGFFVWLALVAWLFSQPPYFTFPYFKIYMPSFFIYKILPMFRAYCRFGIVVMLAVSVLAGFGLKFILGRFRGNRTKALFTSLVCGLVLFEFVNFPPFKVMDLTKYPKVYDWLKNQEGDLVIAEYPLDSDGPNEYYKFCQTIHEKKIINGTIPGTYANEVAKAIWKLSEPRTVGILSWMKVKYALVHKNAYESNNDINLLDELEKLKAKKIEGLRFIRNFEDVDVYEVTARPMEPRIERR